MKIAYMAKIRCDKKNTQLKFGAASLAFVLLLGDF